MEVVLARPLVSWALTPHWARGPSLPCYVIRSLHLYVIYIYACVVELIYSLSGVGLPTCRDMYTSRIYP